MTVPLRAIDGLRRPALARVLESMGIGEVHTDHVFAALHRPNPDVDWLGTLGWRKRDALETLPRSDVRVVDDVRASDGTRKLLFETTDGVSRVPARVEGVLIPHRQGGVERTTLCVSTQAGCAMDCAFCATGRLGLTRGLDPAEIVAQVRLARQRVGRLHRIVFMGMGEPLHHYRATADAIHLMTDHHGLMQPMKSLTVSTVGLVPGIRRLGREFGGRVQLAISLHAGTDALRQRLVPVARQWPLAQLEKACAEYPRPPSRRHVLVEYVLLPGVNDTPAELEGVARWVDGLGAVVNLIPWNPFDGATFDTPTSAQIERAAETLRGHGVHVTVRTPRGREASAACGQLALTGATA